MTMTMHKLTAGGGYLYLVRQVAAADSTELSRSSLADYYSAKGEAPGRWMGRGLSALAGKAPAGIGAEDRQRIWAVAEGSEVSEAQMAALFGDGHHPNADRISAYMGEQRLSGRAHLGASKLGRAFDVRAGEPEFSRRLAVAYRDHNAEVGPHWNATIDPDVRAGIRTRIAVALFTEQYGRPPADDRELSGFIARNTRARTTAVAGYDLTFSPVKSVSSLWAIAPHAVSAQIEDAHDAAVADVLAWLEQSAAFTRTGTNGVAQVDTEGLIATAFTHRDSRAGDPDLHTHVAVSNKVCHVDANGVPRWLALDGQPLHRVTVAASELYNTQLEAHLGRSLGVRFVDVDKGRGKRSVREIDGVPSELMTRWSSRRAAIEARTAELAKAFQADHGREPTNIEIIALAQQATLESREAKHEPRSLAEQRHTWRTQALEVLGRGGLKKVLAATAAGPAHIPPGPAIDEQWISECAAEMIGIVSAARATWQRHHVRAEALRQLRTRDLAGRADLVDALTDAALSEQHSVPQARIGDGELGEPVALLRRDGSSVYTRNGTQTYTGAAILAAEGRVLEAVGRTDGRQARAEDVELASNDAAARGRTLNAGQMALVEEMATSGQRVALALAPAGTGKTTAMAALSHAWRSSGGTVLGLAPTADAAIVLGTDLDAPTDTLDKYVFSASPQGAVFGTPDWFTKVGPDTLIVVDEAGKASTLGLDAMISHALQRGASVRLIGDDGQLSSISAGGIVRDIAEATNALTLSEVVRFRSAAEAAAGLALHDGDPAGIGFYIDNHRIHVGAEQTAADLAYQAWRADLAAGVDSILLAPTNDIIDGLNARARTDRLAADPTTATGPTVTLADGLVAGIGDTIRTRKNARWIRIGRSDFVRNGYRYTITDITAVGAIKARHLRSGRIVTLPADYLADHVTLGYAATIDSAQGLTAGSRQTNGTCHIVGNDALSRQHLYVALTRATDENHVYLSTAEADPHRVLSPKATHPDTAVDVLTRILARDGAQVSATTAQRHAHDPAQRLAAAADMYYDALGAAAEHRLGPGARDRLDVIAESVLVELSTRQAWPVLRRSLAVQALHGADPQELLADAYALGSIDNAADPAAVLDYRIDPTKAHTTGFGPLPWLPTIPAPLADDPHWGAYLDRRKHLVETLSDAVRSRAKHWTNATAPVWARPLITVDAALTAEIAVFRAATGVKEADTRLTGPTQSAIATRSFQKLVYRLAATAVGARSANTTRWHDLIDSIDPRIRGDAYWPQLSARLAQAARTSTDLRSIITDAAAQGPLPDELPAAALWWRIAGTLSPIATVATCHSRMRPPWIGDIAAIFGAALAETITSDPAWPGLVAAINAADPHTWTPRDLLTLAAEHLADATEETGAPIPLGDYTRLITYTVDAFTHRLRDQHGRDHTLIPMPDEAPLSPDDEEQLPPDPDNPLFADHALFNPDDLSQQIPDTTTRTYSADHLQFEDYTEIRPAPALGTTVENVETLRQEYRKISRTVTELAADIRADNGPARRGADTTVLHLRARIDADRPHALAIAAIVEQWSDADAAYDDAVLLVEHARTQLATLTADPDADPLDIESARAALAFHTALLPAQPPSQHYQQALAQAYTARVQAAGGAHNIVTERDIVSTRGAADGTDRAELRTLRDQRTSLSTRIAAAERHVAAAFAAAQTSRDEYLEQLLTAAKTEITLLQAAIILDKERGALTIPDTALTGHPLATATALRTIAALPFTVTPVCADDTTQTRDAFHTLRAAANAAGRPVLWLSPTQTLADQAAEYDLADAAVTFDQAHVNLTTGTWTLPAGTIVVAHTAGAATPNQLTELALNAAKSRTHIVLVDTGTTGPASSAVHLLNTSLPWSATLTHHIDLDTPHATATSAITLAAKLGYGSLNSQWGQLLNHYTNTTYAARAYYRQYLGQGWKLPTIAGGIDEPGIDVGID